MQTGNRHDRRPVATAAEQQLLRRLRAGDASAFQTLVRPHLGALLALSQRLTGDTHWAEDLVQETLVRAFEVLAREIQPPALAARCCAELGWAAGATALVGGQADDLASEGSDGDLSQLEAIHRRKTGAMFVVSVRSTDAA